MTPEPSSPLSTSVVDSARAAPAEGLRRSLDRYVFRELHEPDEIVALVRLRHHVYFNERGYGTPKPFGLDLTAHDTRSRMFGVFGRDRLMGGLRVVYRTEQAASLVFRALRAVVEAPPPLASAPLLPTEEAFDLGSLPGLSPADVHAEISRLVLSGTADTPWLVGRTITGVLATLLAERCPYYLYSCGVSIARRYARHTNPRWTLKDPVVAGIASDNFSFPMPTLAAVARPEDAEPADAILDYSRQMSRAGVIVLTRPEKGR